MFQEEYDVIVVGAGHAGSEAAAAANLGSKTFGYNEPTEHCANVSILPWEELQGTNSS
jgi:tRNA uridine 5-carboxymethylaminomethyl modification enzyme